MTLWRSSKEPRSHKTQFQWAKTAVGPGGDGFSVSGPHRHSIMGSQNKYSKATHKTIAITGRRNIRMESNERTTPTYHVENTTTPRWASSGTTQPYCSRDNCVTFTQSTRGWGEETAVRFTAPYLCAAEITCVCGGDAKDAPTLAEPRHLSFTTLTSTPPRQATATTEDKQNGKRRGRARWNHLLYRGATAHQSVRYSAPLWGGVRVLRLHWQTAVICGHLLE